MADLHTPADCLGPAPGGRKAVGRLYVFFFKENFYVIFEIFQSFINPTRQNTYFLEINFLGEGMLSFQFLHLFDSFFCELEMRNILITISKGILEKNTDQLGKAMEP